jgi:peptide-methionine (R)-S-oxide reductase
MVRHRGEFRYTDQPRPPAGLVTEERIPVDYNVTKTDEEWRDELSPEEYQVLRQQATERPWTGELLDENRVGVYKCKACGAELFTSDTKFDSHCGWPSFYAPKEGDAVKLFTDNSLGMSRVEVVCSNCGSHLGHVFDDAPQTPTGDRFCMNSVSLSFTTKD